MTPRSRWLSLIVVLACAAALPAQNPPAVPENPAVKEFTQKVDQALKALETPKAHLQEPRYAEEDHAAVSKALGDLTALLEPVKSKLPDLASAVGAAVSEETAFWNSSKALSAQPDAYKAAAKNLSGKLTLIRAGVDSLLGRNPAAAGDGPAEAQARLKSILVDPFDHKTGASLAGGGPAVAATGANGIANAALVNPSAPGVRLDQGGVPPTSGGVEPARPKPSPTELPQSLQTLGNREAALAAAEAVPPFSQALARQRAVVGREWRLIQSVRSGADWVMKHRDELKAAGQNPDAFQLEINAALAKPEGQREQALLLLERRLDQMMSSSRMGQAEAELRRQLAAANGQLSQIQQQQLIVALTAMKESDPNYFKARGLWAEYVNFNRAHLKSFPNGTSFKGEELGLPPPQDAATLTKAALFGGTGIMTAGADGSRHFEGADGSVADEILSDDGKSKFWVRRKKDAHGLVIATYDDKGNKVGGVVYEKGKNGAVVMHPEGKELPRQTGRMVEGRFVAEKIENEDGTSRELAGPAAPGAWIFRDKQGGAAGWTLDPAVLGRGSQAERNANAEKLARWAVAQGFARSGSGTTDDYRAQSVASLLRDVFRHEQRGETQVYLDRKEGKLVIDQSFPGGVHQIVAKFEDTYSGWGVGNGLPKQGLSMYVRTARSLDDQRAEFIRIVQYEGDWGRESTTNTTASNLDEWYSWITGPKVTETAHTYREYRKDDGRGGWVWQRDNEHVAVGKPAEVYNGVGIVGATGHMLETVGKGVTNLAGAGVAVGLAYSPAYLALVKLTGGDVAYAQDDLLARAKVDFFNNAISSELGEIYVGNSYVQGKRNLNLDYSRDIQNVRQEMTDAGHPITGAILGGGVKFSNSVAPLLLMGGAMEGVATLGNTGRVAASLTGYYMGGQAVVQLGAAGKDFTVASWNYAHHQNDPAARQAFYDNIENMTFQSLNAPMTLAVIGQVRNAIKGRSLTPEAAPQNKERAPPGAKPKGIGLDRELDLSFMKRLVPDAVARLDARIPELVRGQGQGKFRNVLADQLGLPKLPVEKPVYAPADMVKAERVLGGKPDEAVAEAIESSHRVGEGELGKDGTPARVGNYTLAQIRAKYEILSKAGLNSGQIRALMENGVVGHGDLPFAERYFTKEEFAAAHPMPEGVGVYHDLSHSTRVSEMAVEFAKGRGLAEADATFVGQVALLHDFDPGRAPGTPARVPETLRRLRQDFSGELSLTGEKGTSVLKDRFGWDEAALRRAEAMIQRTEFPFGDSHPNPYYKEASPLARYRHMLEGLPPGDRRFVLREGALLSEYADKSSHYSIEDFKGAVGVVQGLVGEINTSVGKPVMDIGKLNTPDFLSKVGDANGNWYALDKQLAREFGDSQFHLPNRAQAFAQMPPEYGRTFESNLKGFQAYQEALGRGESPELAMATGERAARPTPVATVDPAFEGYLRKETGVGSASLLKQRVPREQIRGMLRNYFEESGTSASSARANALLELYGFAEKPSQSVATAVMERGGSSSGGLDLTQEVPQISPPKKISGLQMTDRPGGGTHGGRWFKDSDGNNYFGKQGNRDRLASEHLANQIYRLFDISAPETQLVEFKGQPLFLSRELPGRIAGGPSALARTDISKGFVIDAWLANRDVLGPHYDNVLIEGGKAHRIDSGGSLGWLGLEGRRPFGPVVEEINSMRKPEFEAGQVFGRLGKTELLQQIKDFTAKYEARRAQIEKAVDESGVSEPLAAQIKEALAARARFLKAMAAKYEPAGTSQPPAAAAGSAHESSVKDLSALQADQALIAKNPNGISADGKFLPDLGYIAKYMRKKVETLFTGQKPEIVSDILDQQAFLTKAAKEGLSLKNAGGLAAAVHNHIVGGETSYFISTTARRATAFNDFGFTKGYVIEIRPQKTRFFSTRSVSEEGLGSHAASHESEYLAYGEVPINEIPAIHSTISNRAFDLSDPGQVQSLRDELAWVKSTTARNDGTLDTFKLRSLWKQKAP